MQSFLLELQFRFLHIMKFKNNFAHKSKLSFINKVTFLPKSWIFDHQRSAFYFQKVTWFQGEITLKGLSYYYRYLSIFRWIPKKNYDKYLLWRLLSRQSLSISSKAFVKSLLLWILLIFVDRILNHFLLNIPTNSI